MPLAPQKLGIIAGSGQFPQLVADAARAAGHYVAICGFNGFTDEALARHAEDFVLLRLGQLAKLIDFFKSNGVTQVCMAGAIKKPKLKDFRPDLRAAKLFFKLNSQGDNSILHAFANELNTEGFEVVQAASFLPQLHSPAGVLTKRAPTGEDWESIRYGWPVGRTLGQFDIGQCLILRKRMVVAVEGVEGTDAAIARGGEYGGPGCVAIKMLKPGQDTRIDLPSMGLNTIELMVKHQYSCLAYEAGKSIFFDLDESIRLAERNGICLIGLTEKDLTEF